MFPLNDDILHEILSIVQDDKPLLCSLARVNKHMSTLVSPYIFRDVDLYVSENILPFNMLRSLVRSINERPSLALHVRSLYLDWEYDNRNHPARLQIFESEANDLFARLINLHTFQLDTVGSNVMCFEYKILRLNPMKALRKVIIRDRVIDIDDVALWLLRPNLEVLMLDGVTHYPGVLQTMAAFHPESRLKNLTRLKLQDPFSIPHLLLQGILQFNPPLKKIKLSKPSYERPMNWPEGETYVPSSAGILNIIQSVRETLVTLTLTSKGNATCKMPFSCDYDCLNMSAFTSLKRLKAPADCFFGSPWLTPSRNGTFKLLLNSLEVLKVSETTTGKMLM